MVKIEVPRYVGVGGLQMQIDQVADRIILTNLGVHGCSEIRNVNMLVTQSCLTLCDPMGYSRPDSSVLGILQARILEWVAIPFSRGIFLTRESKPGLPHCRQILYYVIYQGSCRS